MAANDRRSDESAGRRGFIKTMGLGAAAASAMALNGCAMPGGGSKLKWKPSKNPALTREGVVVLFQGDSITDAGRDKRAEGNANHSGAMGRGYVNLIASQLLADNAAAMPQIYNRGISGNRVPNLDERWEKDCLEIKPDVLSILIGVNDIWHKLNGQYDGTAKTYEDGYMALVDRTLKTLPQVRLIVCEPFVLKCGAVTDKWFPEFHDYRAAARRVAEAFDATFVPFQAMFDEAIKVAPPNWWAGDGVHPSMAGAERMAQTWMKYVNG